MANPFLDDEPAPKGVKVSVNPFLETPKVKPGPEVQTYESLHGTPGQTGGMAPRGIGSRMSTGIKSGFGEDPVSEQQKKQYPFGAAVAEGLALPGRAMGAATGAVAGGAAGLLEKMGVTPAMADRFMRDIPGWATAIGTEAGAAKVGAKEPQIPSPKEMVQVKPPAPPPSLGEVEARVGIPREGGPTPAGMGEGVAADIMAQRGAQKAVTQQKYRDVWGQPGELHGAAVEGLGNQLRARLDKLENPVVIDDKVTPNASAMIQDIDKNISNFKIQDRSKGDMPKSQREDIIGVNLKGIDQVRRRMKTFSDNAYSVASRTGDQTDVRAVTAIKKAFDDHIEQAMSEGLFSGDPKTLDMLKDARKSASLGKSLFGTQGKYDDVGTAMKKIVERGKRGETQAQDVANLVLGAGKIGATEFPARFVDRLEQIGVKMQPIREAIWQKTQAEPAEINRLVNSNIGKKLFDAPVRKAMMDYARTPDKDLNLKAKAATAVANALVMVAAHKVPILGHALAPALRRAANIQVPKPKPVYGGVD